VSSFQAAAAALKTELTAPEVAQTIILTRTSGRTPLPKEQELEQLAKTHARCASFLRRAIETIAATWPSSMERIAPRHWSIALPGRSRKSSGERSATLPPRSSRRASRKLP